MTDTIENIICANVTVEKKKLYREALSRATTQEVAVATVEQ